jgi:hypothetical protein
MAVNQSGESAAARNTQNASAHSHSSQTTGAPATQREATLLQDISKVIEGLERCEGLRDVIQQIESGAVATIRARYGPSADGRRKTADPSWGKYKNLVSKRERLQRILAEDFGGDKDKFFDFFSVKSSGEKEKKRKRADEGPAASKERFQPYRGIVEARPWCETDVVAERQKEHYRSAAGEFSEELWVARWGTKNTWEVWRDMKMERYVKQKKSR